MFAELLTPFGIETKSKLWRPSQRSEYIKELQFYFVSTCVITFNNFTMIYGILEQNKT